jgi:predicted ArsR family transcriptional regulator
MADPGEPEAFDDVNKAVRDEWRAKTTPYERIREVISRTYTPTDADTLADEACTSPKTARKHLNTLAGDRFVATETGTNGATLYRRSTESLVVEQAGDILSQISTEDLRDRIAEMREQLTEFQRQYGVESPEELAIDRTNELLDESGNGEREPDDETLREWTTTRRNLAFANAALSIANAEKFVETGSRRHSESVSSP